MFGDIHGPKHYEFVGSRATIISHIPVSRSLSFGSSSKHTEIGSESFGIVVRRSVGAVPGILGLVWPSFRPKSGSRSKISGRILERFRGPVSSAEWSVRPHSAVCRWFFGSGPVGGTGECEHGPAPPLRSEKAHTVS